MSEQKVLDFLEMTRNDAALFNRAKASSSISEVMSVAEEAGFSFTEADVIALSGELKQAEKSLNEEELSDTELDQVSAGVTINNNHYTADVLVTINNSHREIFGGFYPLF